MFLWLLPLYKNLQALWPNLLALSVRVFCFKIQLKPLLKKAAVQRSCWFIVCLVVVSKYAAIFHYSTKIQIGLLQTSSKWNFIFSKLFQNIILLPSKFAPKWLWSVPLLVRSQVLFHFAHNSLLTARSVQRGSNYCSLHSFFYCIL